jgi:RNA polymerase-binding transcription factor DksA
MCRKEAWYKRNADRLEELIAKGLSLAEAKREIAGENRAICIVCGEPIPGRHRGSTMFCTRTEKCRKVQGKFYYRVKNGIEPAHALDEVLREVVGV